MQSDNLHTLYQRLLDVVEKTATAFETMDVTTLAAMRQEHRSLLTAISEKGDCQEESMLNIMENINSRIQLLGEKMREKRDDLCEQLLMAKRKKQAVAVYANDGLGPYVKMPPSNNIRNGYKR